MDSSNVSRYLNRAVSERLMERVRITKDMVEQFKEELQIGDSRWCIVPEFKERYTRAMVTIISKHKNVFYADYIARVPNLLDEDIYVKKTGCFKYIELMMEDPKYTI